MGPKEKADSPRPGEAEAWTPGARSPAAPGGWRGLVVRTAAGAAAGAVGSARFYAKQPLELVREVLSGFAVSTHKLPESLAFAFLAGVHPRHGLQGSFLLGSITAFVGGRPGAISGCAAATAMVAREVMLDDGPFGNRCPRERLEFLLFTIVFAGMLQFGAGAAQCARLVRLIPRTCVLGFYNGVAIAIFVAQINTFRRPLGSMPGCPQVDFGIRESNEWHQLDQGITWLMLLHVALCFLVMELITRLPPLPLGKIDRIPLSHIMPPTLSALLVVAFVEWCIIRPSGSGTPLIRDISPINSDVPLWHVPDVPWGDRQTWAVCFPIAARFGAVGLLESMLALQAADHVQGTETDTLQRIQECMVQGISNVGAGLFGGLGGSGNVYQTTENAKNGARGRVSAVVDAFFLLLYMGVIGGWIESLPIAGISGILFVVSVRLFRWTTLSIIVRRSVPVHMCATMVLVTAIGATTNLAYGVFTGILWECVWFAWKEGERLNVKVLADKSSEAKSFATTGTILFTNSEQFSRELAAALPSAPDNVVVDLRHCRLADLSATAALDDFGKRCQKAGKKLFVEMRNSDFHRFVALSDEASDDGGSSREGGVLHSLHRVARRLPTYEVSNLRGWAKRHERPTVEQLMSMGSQPSQSSKADILPDLRVAAAGNEPAAPQVGPSSPQASPTGRSRLLSYLLDNSRLHATTTGLVYRRSKGLQDVSIAGDQGLRWGATIRGWDEGDGWLRIEDRYLPTSIDGKPVLLLQATEYLADNSRLEAVTASLQIHGGKPQQAGDSCPGYGTVPWGSRLWGTDQGDGWLKLEERYLPMVLSGVKVLVEQEDKSYVVTGDGLPEQTEGLQLRRSKDLEDTDSDVCFEALPWGTSVRGTDDGDGWLKLEDRFVATAIGGVPVVARQAASKYRVDNSQLQEASPGLWYRLSKRMTDLDPGEFRGPEWGSTVRGVDHGDGWLKVEDCFLPLVVDGVPVLISQAPSGRFGVGRGPTLHPPLQPPSGASIAVPGGTPGLLEPMPSPAGRPTTPPPWAGLLVESSQLSTEPGGDASLPGMVAPLDSCIDLYGVDDDGDDDDDDVDVKSEEEV